MLAVLSACIIYNTYGQVHLIPQHLLTFYEQDDPLKLLNHVVINGGLHPVNLSIDVSTLDKAFSALRRQYQLANDHE